MRIPGVRALASDYDDFFVDLWGVIHAGERPFEGVLGALEGIAAAGDKRVVFVTNTSRTSDAVIDTLVGRMGIARELFVDVVSSGDVTRAALVGRDPAVFGALSSSPRCFHYGDAAFVPWLFETGLTMVDEPEVAELVVASGAPADAEALGRARELLAPVAARGTAMVCTNPDRVIPRAAGPGLGPGALAEIYGELGGRVFLYGKPHAPIYDEARRRLGAGSSRRVVAIGDLLETDVRGARAAGIPSVLVTREGPTSVGGIAPDMVLARFAW